MALDGANGISKGVFFDPSKDVNSFFTYGSKGLFGNTRPGTALETASQLMNVIKTPVKISADPKAPDAARELFGGISDAFGLPASFGSLTNQNTGVLQGEE